LATAKALICFSTLGLAQAGQLTARAELTSFSKGWPQAWQIYSKIGIFTLLDWIEFTVFRFTLQAEGFFSRAR
jgi:hypothetical protein